MVPSTRPVFGQSVLLELARDAEVGDLGPPVGVDQHVLGLDVAVHEPPRVGRAEPSADLDRVGGRLVERQPAAVAVDPRLQRLAVDVLEDDVRARPPSSPASITATTFGCETWATARASRRKRSIWSG